ncbi:MAG: YifB family Mg chelatase-like AAA ATPase [Deltaproteobacteria bacterium]|nr:YifB family Mg chelatase-like AAA ATPase [Deltaproteobacteria bacterium]
MIARIAGGSLHGVDAFPVTIEVDYARSGIPAFTLVGLAEAVVRESRDRVFTALRNSGLRLSPARITVNLAPAGVRKTSSAFDLPLAVGLMTAAGLIPEEAVQGYVLGGELSLTGEVKPVPGILPLAVLARNSGARGLFVPADNAREASVVDGLPVFAVAHLNQAISFLTGEGELAPFAPGPMEEDEPGRDAFALDFLDVKGQEQAKRAVEIAAAGGHNLLFLGPPGSGKTMLSRRIPSILPPLTFEESLEVTKIYSVAGLLKAGQSLIRDRPFRAPHHTVSAYGLTGGGMYPKPGEISLAHRGVLFLDELLEFQKHTLEILRQPLEQGSVTVTRAVQSVTYPADFMLVAAMNPCPCGYLTDARKACTCSPMDIRRYRARLSGPLLDRIDLHVEVPSVPYADLAAGRIGRSSAEMRANVHAARAVQTARYRDTPFRANADLSGRALEIHCRPGGEGHAFLRSAVESLRLSARAYTRVLRIARTIADLDGREEISTAHLAEAVNCRALDRPG